MLSQVEKRIMRSHTGAWEQCSQPEELITTINKMNICGEGA